MKIKVKIIVQKESTFLTSVSWSESMKMKVKIIVQKESTFLTSVSWSESGGREHKNTGVVHMRNQRNTQKECFLRLNTICKNRDWASKRACFLKKKGLF